MRLPTRLMIKENRGGWNEEFHETLEHALLRWMLIPVKRRYGGLLSEADGPKPREPSSWEIKLGLLCVTQGLQARAFNRITTKFSGKDIDPAYEYPHVETIVAFGVEVEERSNLGGPDEVSRWERGIARLMETTSRTELRWAKGRVPPPRRPDPPAATDGVEDADWFEVPAEAASTAVAGPVSADALSRAVAMAATGDASRWAPAMLASVPVAFPDDAAAAAWARSVANALRDLATAALPPPQVEDTKPDIAAPEPVVETTVEAEETSVGPETAEPPVEPDVVAGPEPVRGKRPKRNVERAPEPSKPSLTALETKVLNALSTFSPMRKIEVARVLDHGRGAVNRAMDALTVKGAAQDVGEGRYVRAGR